MSNKNICIISESQSAKNPESFIKAHKDLLDGNIHFLYGGTLPKFSEKYGELAKYPNILERILIKLKLNKTISPLKKGLIKYLKHEKIDLVLAEYGTTGAQVFSICKELNIPLIVHFHGYDISKYKLVKWHKELYKEMFDYADAIIAVSEDMKADLIKVGAKEKKINVTPCGPNEKFGQLVPNYHSNTFLALGRFVDKKAPYYTIMAFNEVQKEYPELKLVMIGGGYLLNASKNLVKYLKLENKISIKGGLNHNELFSYFEDAFCFVQHSIIAEDGDSEGTPVAILEAASAGLPIISTKHKGIKQAVLHNKTGFLVDEHDVESMIKYMKSLAKDRNRCEKIGKNGKQHISDNYTLEKHISILNSTIEGILYE